MSDLDRFVGKSAPPRPAAATQRNWNCDLCLGTGMVFAVRTGSWVDRTDLAAGREWVAHQEHDRTTPTIFRCPCYRGQSDRRAFPRWDDAPKNEYRKANV